MVTVAGPARALNGLLSEVVLLMPPTKELLEAPFLWEYIEHVAIPILNHFERFRNAAGKNQQVDEKPAIPEKQIRKSWMMRGAKSKKTGTKSKSAPEEVQASVSADIELTEDVLDLVEDTFTELNALNLWRNAQLSHGKLISDLANAAQGILVERFNHPIHLEEAFKIFTLEKRKKLEQRLKHAKKHGGEELAQAEADMVNADVMTLLEFKDLMHDYRKITDSKEYKSIIAGENADTFHRRPTNTTWKAMPEEVAERVPVDLSQSRELVFGEAAGKINGFDERDIDAPLGQKVEERHNQALPSLARRRKTQLLVKIGTQYPGLSALMSTDEDLLDKAFEVADVNFSQTIELVEFVEIFETLNEGASDQCNGNEGLKRGRLSRRAALCAKRILYFARNGEYGWATKVTPNDPSPPIPPRGSTLTKHGRTTSRKSLTHAQRLIEIAPGEVNLMEQASPLPTGDLSEQFAAFQVACRHNYGIIEAVNSQRFSMVTSMHLGGCVEKKGKAVDYGPNSKWDEVSVRMLKFIEDNFLDANEAESVLRCFFVLQTHLVFARTGGKKQDSVLDFRDLDEKARDLYVLAQDRLDYLGLTTLLAKILMEVRMGDEGSVADIAVQLFIELLVGGNPRVQQTLFWCVYIAFNFVIVRNIL